MKAMILAAGLGTRLKPLTDNIPKALVEVKGVPMLERVICNMKDQGFNQIVVNVHHFAEKIIEFLNTKDFGVEISISDEKGKLLDTGGGIVNAMPLLFKNDDSPVLIHNVDILSNAVLKDVMDSVKDNGAALFVSERGSSRKLIFDKHMNLRGWHDINKEKFRPEGYCLSKDDSELAFSGIYAMSLKGVEEMEAKMGKEPFSVMDYFLLPTREKNIKGVKSETLKILDIGKPATLLQASSMVE